MYGINNKISNSHAINDYEIIERLDSIYEKKKGTSNIIYFKRKWQQR